MKTGCVALVLCLNISVDPPDVIKISPCARMECWIGTIVTVLVLSCFSLSLFLKNMWLYLGLFCRVFLIFLINASQFLSIHLLLRPMETIHVTSELK